MITRAARQTARQTVRRTALKTIGTTIGITVGTTVGMIIGSHAAAAAEVTMRMKGGDFAIIGQVIAFDGVKYTIQSKSLGQMALASQRFECIGASCPASTMTVAVPVSFNTMTPATSLQLIGSGTVADQLMPGLIKGFAEENRLSLVRIPNPALREDQFKLDFGGRSVGVIDLNRSGTSAGFKALETGASAIAITARQVSAAEADQLARAGVTNIRAADSEHVLGLDGLQVLVPRDNNLISITPDNLARVFAGLISDWSELGGAPGKINVYAPAEGSDSFDAFDQAILQPRKLQISKAAIRTLNHAEQSDWVARDLNGIGLASITFQRNAKALGLQQSCGIVTAPTSFNIKSEEYPLSRRLYLYTPHILSQPLAQSLVSYALSPAGQAIVKQHDFIDQSPELLSYDQQVVRIANSLNAPPEQFDAALMNDLVRETKAGKRISLTFRFERNSFKLDNKALADIARLKAALQSPEYRGLTVSLLGFADPRGSFIENAALSERRARAVHTALSADRTLITRNYRIKGYGSLAPVACSEDETGRHLNRRVEIWVK